MRLWMNQIGIELNRICANDIDSDKPIRWLSTGSTPLMLWIMERHLNTAEDRWAQNWVRNVYAITFGITQAMREDDHWLWQTRSYYVEHTQELVDRLGGLWRYILRNSNKVIYIIFCSFLCRSFTVSELSFFVCFA